ncbi:condensation domain protein [Mycobacterium xenopi 3993]|nr:condensation domain protein [Mycobacterium xenopi 3993]
MQAGFAQLLMLVTGHQDVAFGTTVSGRPAEVAGAEAMVGLLINTVPVRARVTAATTTSGLLDQLHGTHNHTLEHQHLALAEIHRVSGHDQLFDTLFVFENYPLDTAALASGEGLTVTGFTNREYNHYPLAVQAFPGSELGLRVEFDTDVFDTASIETLVKRLQAVWAAMASDPGRRLSSIDVLQPAELACLDEWGNQAVSARPATATVSIPAMFTEQVARTPDAVAVVCGECSTTYRELDETANRLAHLLADRGVGRGSGWRCCFPGRPKRSRRSWRCSKPARLMCRSTRWCLRPGSSSCSPTPHRSRRSPPRTWPTGCTAVVCR